LFQELLCPPIARPIAASIKFCRQGLGPPYFRRDVNHLRRRTTDEGQFNRFGMLITDDDLRPKSGRKPHRTQQAKSKLGVLFS
jgi:hypothetical protein